MLQVNSISFSYSEPIFRNVSFKLGEGEIIGIVGNSGAGKTTLLKIIAGLIDPSSGEILVDNEAVLGPAYNLVPGHEEIKLVNQDFGLDLHQNVKENIQGKILHLPREERDELIAELLELIELDHLGNQKAILLSGGEQQRLALARALAGEPKVILLDEPFVHLDGRLRLKISNYLLEMKKIRSTSFILVSHDGSEILSLADRVIYLSEGEIKRIATPEVFYFSPESYEEAELFGVVNVIEKEGEKIFFRPNEFIIGKEKSNNALNLTFVGSQFAGAYYVNYFLTDQKEKIVLYHNESFNEETEIIIKKRNSSPVMA